MEDDDSNHGSGSGETLNHQIHPPIKSRKRDLCIQQQDTDEGDSDNEVWKPFNDGFRQVQSVLNRNLGFVRMSTSGG